MKIVKQGRKKGVTTQHLVSIKIDEENWEWYKNLRNKSRALNYLMGTQRLREATQNRDLFFDAWQKEKGEG